MPKEFSLPNLVGDLHYIVFSTYVHEWLFGVCPPRPGLAVLEPGCGSGKFALSYALKGGDVNLFDIDEEVVRYARRLKSALEVLADNHLDAHIWQGDIFAFEENWGVYDLVFNEGVPQHWPDEGVPQHWPDEKRQGCIDRMARWAKPGGLVVIVGNNGHNPQEQETDRAFKFTYEGMPPTRRCFTREELETRMAWAGLKDVQVAPLGVPDLQHLPVRWTAATLLGAYGRK